MQPTYYLNDMIHDCKFGINRVIVTYGAMETAREELMLGTQEIVCDFIANGGLQSPKFINSKIWENNPHPESEIMVDAYSFFAGSIFCYMAFFNNRKKWIIKSFKKNVNSKSIRGNLWIN